MARYHCISCNDVILHMCVHAGIYFAQVGKPIPVTKMEKSAITEKHVDELHALFVAETRRLFERTKVKNGVDPAVELQIL